MLFMLLLARTAANWNKKFQEKRFSSFKAAASGTECFHMGKLSLYWDLFPPCHFIVPEGRASAKVCSPG